jgi:hypothetical protein
MRAITIPLEGSAIPPAAHFPTYHPDSPVPMGNDRTGQPEAVHDPSEQLMPRFRSSRFIAATSALRAQNEGSAIRATM